MFLRHLYDHSPFRGLAAVAGLFLALSACHQKNSSGTAGISTPADSTQKNYFPVPDIIRAEIRYVDSMPLAILKCATAGNHTDSSFIKPDEFHRLAQEFIVPELAKENFETKYTETSFMDETSGFMTFTYAPRDRDQALQRVDVLVTPAAAGNGTDQIKSIYLQTSRSSADTLIVKKMLWMAKKSMLIVTSLETHVSAPVTRQVKVVWDASPAEQ